MRSRRTIARVVGLAAVSNLLLLGWPAGAQSEVTYVDLTAGAGYSSNPLWRTIDSDGSAFGRLSALFGHTRQTERSSSAVTAYIENTTYLGGLGSEQIFDVNGNLNHQVSERTRVFASANFSGDTGGQLGNRFITTPRDFQVLDPTLPPAPIASDPEFFAFGGRHFSVGGQVGATTRASERSTVTGSVGGRHSWFSRAELNSYSTIFASGSYDRVLSERSTGGLRLSVHRSMYREGESSLIVNPEVTGRTRLSTVWTAEGAVGLSFAKVDSGQNDRWSTSVSVNGAVCRDEESEQLCIRASRHALSTSRAALTTATTASIDWMKRLDERQTVRLSAGATRYASDKSDILDTSADHARITGNYDRRVGQRLSTGAIVGARKLRQVGPNPDVDLHASAYIRYRLGDVR